MRSLAIAMIALIPLGSASPADDVKTISDKQVSEALRDVHDRGSDMYSDKDYISCLRLYEGGLFFAKSLLAHRPKTQKIISDGIAEAQRLESPARRAFRLHEVIEAVRDDLRIVVPAGPERLEIPPREMKKDVKPAANVTEVSTGVLGRVLWQGQPISGVDVMFVSIGRLDPKVYETSTGAQGVYVIADLQAGKYLVTINPGPKCSVKKLPERYATTTTSPLLFEVKGKGEKLDFLLQ